MQTSTTLSSEFGHWLAGYIDGEGHFGCGIYKNGHGGVNVIHTMTLVARADEFPLLARCQRETGLGRLYFTKRNKGSNPCWRWEIKATDECLRLVDILTQYPLQSKKRQDFQVWSDAIREHASWVRPGRGPKNDQTKLRAICARLRRGREYDSSYERN